MKCPFCEKNVEPIREFCPECGERISTIDYTWGYSDYDFDIM